MGPRLSKDAHVSKHSRRVCDHLQRNRVRRALSEVSAAKGRTAPPYDTKYKMSGGLVGILPIASTRLLFDPDRHWRSLDSTYSLLSRQRGGNGFAPQRKESDLRWCRPGLDRAIEEPGSETGNNLRERPPREIVPRLGAWSLSWNQLSS